MGRLRSTDARGNILATNSIIRHFGGGTSSIVCRLQSRQGLELRVTPLVLPVATIFAEDISTSVSIDFPAPLGSGNDGDMVYSSSVLNCL